MVVKIMMETCTFKLNIVYKIEFYYEIVVAPPFVTAQKSIHVVVVFIEKCLFGVTDCSA